METLKILATDDEPGMRMAITRALNGFKIVLPDIGEEVGFDVRTAESGEEALESILKTPPDILLLDHKLPGISGLEVLDKMQEKNAQGVLTVMITAYASLDTAVSAIKKGAFDFLAKPFTPAELKDKVTKAAESLIIARQARKLAREKRQVRFQFISVLAHELKSPLGAIEGYLHLLKEGPSVVKDPAMFGNILERCIVRTSQMRKLIVDLLEITRIESGQKKRDLEEVDLSAIGRSAVETVTPEAMQRRITVRMIVEGHPTMTADRSEIEIILNNLLSNAVKYNRDQGQVELKIEEKDERIVISVSDTGIGMTDQEAQRLFQEFVRIRNEKTQNTLGSGLGLSIVKKLAFLYGGGVSISSRPDEGSTFTVTLNRSPGREEKPDGAERDTELA